MKSLFLSKSKGIKSCMTKTYFIDMNRSFYKPCQYFLIKDKPGFITNKSPMQIFLSNLVCQNMNL